MRGDFVLIVEQNASVFPNPDTAFILAFSIVMLNTDLHNPSIAEARRMKKGDFSRPPSSWRAAPALECAARPLAQEVVELREGGVVGFVVL